MRKGGSKSELTPESPLLEREGKFPLSLFKRKGVRGIEFSLNSKP
jgi:hypothetical protein